MGHASIAHGDSHHGQRRLCHMVRDVAEELDLECLKMVAPETN